MQMGALKAPHLIDAVLRLREGDLLRILNPPIWVGADTLDLIVQGYSEEIGVRTWEITLNCSPAIPWVVGVVGDPVLGRADTDGSELTASVTATATFLTVASTVGPEWTADLTDLPLDVRVGGEIMTVTNITGARGDRFERSVTGGWGVSTSGHAWTTTGGSAADYSVQGG